MTGTRGKTETQDVRHPAKFSPEILLEIRRALYNRFGEYPSVTVLDPFSGVGGIHMLGFYNKGFQTYAIELEPEWAKQSADRGPTACGDFFEFEPAEHAFVRGNGIDGDGELIDGPSKFRAIVTSPTYGNRMADSHTPSPSDTSRRITYTHTLGRKLSENNSGAMQWGDAYRAFHIAAWKKCRRLLLDDGLFIVNVKDHVRNKKIAPVVAWHRKVIQQVGFELIEDRLVAVKGMRMGENHELRVDHEHVLVYKKVMDRDMTPTAS